MTNNWLNDAWGENPLADSNTQADSSELPTANTSTPADDPAAAVRYRAQEEEYPDWHPGARGLAEDKPASQDGEQTATEPKTTKAKNTPRTNTGPKARRYNPNRKKGFRRPPIQESAFAPAIGARATRAPHKRAASPGRLFREGSALNEELTEAEEALLAKITAEQNQAGAEPKRKKATDAYTRAKNTVYNQLAYSAKSRYQLRQKLESKGFETELIESLLDKFEAAHLIDDAEYARSFVTQRGTGKKLSRSALRRELKERGITGDLAEEALAARTDEDERRDAAELVRKKLRPAMNFSDRTEKEKIMRRLVGMLARRGYSSSVAFSVVKEEIERYCSEWEEDS